MSEQNRCAITAIADSRTESFVAASLVRQGWDVIFRALSYPDLKRFLAEGNHSSAPVFLSPDLKGIVSKSERMIAKEILISTRPENDFEIAELLRERESPVGKVQSNLPSHVKVIAFASIGRGVGTSTLAINLAQEVALHGARTLLIDSHPRSPYLSSHTSLFGLTRGVLASPFKVSLLESASPQHAIQEKLFDSGEFEYLVIDCGEIYRPSEMVHGARREDAAFEWASLHGCELIVVRDESDAKAQMNRERLEEIGRIAIKPHISLLINKCEPSQRKKFSSKSAIAAAPLSPSTSIFSKDTRSVIAMERERSTLAQAAPKSQLRHELLDFAASRNWWRD
ncbi:MAG: hypothetical protein RJA33_671 [Actinomycetota bacterium]|jgi:hypothetical protein